MEKEKRDVSEKPVQQLLKMPLHLTNQNLIKQFPFIDKGVFSNQGGSLTTFSLGQGSI